MGAIKYLFHTLLQTIWIIIKAVSIFLIAFFAALYFSDQKVAADFADSCLSCKKPNMSVMWPWSAESGRLLTVRDWKVILSPPPAQPEVTPELNPTEQEKVAIDRVNYYRGLAGLEAVTQNAAINDAAKAHASYNAHHNLSGHVEYDGDDGFTGVWPWDRLKYYGYNRFAYATEVCSMRWASHDYLLKVDPIWAVDSWIDTVYHRLPIISPNVYEVGFGSSKSEKRISYVMDFANPGFQANKQIIHYPVDDQSNVPIEFTGDETPDPLPGKKYPVGYPITVIFSGYKNIRINNISLTNDKGSSVDYYELLPFSDKHIRDTLAVIPKKPLKRGATYLVNVSAAADGKPVYLEWRFKTKF